MFSFGRRMTALIGAAAAVLALSTAASATPDLPNPPSSGSRPATDAGSAAPPPGSAVPSVAAPTTTDPELLRIAKEEAALEALGEQITESTSELAERTAAYSSVGAVLDAARATVTALDTEASNWAKRAYIAAAGRPAELEPAAPTDESALSDVFAPNGLAGTPLARLAAAERAYTEASKQADAVSSSIAQLTSSLSAMRAELATRSAAIAAARTASADKLRIQEEARNLQNTQLSAKYLKDSTDRAAPAALKAVEYALAQVGKPYVLAAEGPDSFDCSGLVQSAYRTAGVPLPRTARPQYRKTKPAPLSALVRGDLLFFGPDKSNWDSIHHVGIYLGHGEMVHAPRPGLDVMISPIWWEEFFGATRVVPALPPLPKPKPATSQTPTPGPSTKPSPDPVPSPIPSADTSPDPVPSTPPSPDPVPSPPTSPTPSPDAHCPTPTGVVGTPRLPAPSPSGACAS